MKVQVAMDEKPAVVTTDIPIAVKAAETKSNKAKYIGIVVTAVAIVCIVVAVIAGFVVAFKYHAQTTKEMIKSHESFKGIEEDIEEDPEDNSKLYTVKENGETHYVLDDPGRKLMLTKKDGKCILANKNAMDVSQTVMIVDKTPIKNRNVVSQRGQDLCEHSEMYWAYPSCDAKGDQQYNITSGSGDGNLARRSRRDVPYYYCITDCCLDSYCGVGYCVYSPTGCILYVVYTLSGSTLYCDWYIWC